MIKEEEEILKSRIGVYVIPVDDNTESYQISILSQTELEEDSIYNAFYDAALENYNLEAINNGEGFEE